jgi:hypothetical protein
MDAKVCSEIAKNWTEVLAIAIGGGGYFLYRASRGAFTHNLSLSLKCRRKPNPNADRDYLALTVNISKGERYTVELHDAAVRVSWPNGEQISTRVSPLSEVDRKHTKPEKLSAKDWKGNVIPGHFLERRLIVFGEMAWVDPFLRLAPGDQTQFSCCFDVPHAAVCTLEVVVVGKRAWPSWLTGRGSKRAWPSWLTRGSKKVGQWRASAVSAPLSEPAVRK